MTPAEEWQARVSGRALVALRRRWEECGYSVWFHGGRYCAVSPGDRELSAERPTALDSLLMDDFSRVKHARERAHAAG